MSTEKIIDRIKRLLALSTSSNVHEASLAASRAQELMTKYRIEMADLHGNETEPLESIDDDVLFSEKSRIPWKTWLANGIAKANGCRVYTRKLRNGVDTRIIGPTSQSQTVAYMYFYLVREVERLARDARDLHTSDRSWLRSFRLGAVKEITDRMKETNDLALQGAGGSALAVLDKDISRVEEVANALSLRKAPRTNVSDQGAFESGRKAGRTVNISSGPGLGKGSKANLK